MADDINGIFGGYAPNPDPKYITTPLKGLQKLGHSYSYNAGCNNMHCEKYDEAGVKSAVSGVDIVVVCLGTGQFYFIFECNHDKMTAKHNCDKVGGTWDYFKTLSVPLEHICTKFPC